MKKIKLSFLFAVSIFLFSFSTTKVTKITVKISVQDKPPIYKEGATQKITLRELSGKYKLKYTSTLQKRVWTKANSVGLDFFPDTYLYTTGNLQFNTKSSKVTLSSISPIETIPDSKYGSYPFIVNDSRLTIQYNKEKNYAKLDIVSLKKSWLIVEDSRTKQRWAFYKN
jgi:hypothetical protein